MAINIGEEFFKKFGKRYPPESALCKEGESGQTMFIIAQGKVQVTKETPAGEKVLATLSEGDFFGEMAIMGLQPRRGATVTTVVETTVLELSREAFEGLVRRSPEIAMTVIQTLTERIRDANGKLAALIHKNDHVRIAAYLNHLLNERGLPAPRKAVGKCFKLKPDSVAAALGMPVEVVSQWLSFARKSKIAAYHGGWLWVPCPQYLLAFGEFIAARL